MNLIEQIDLRFRSGNSIPIERAHVTAEEWAQMCAALQAAQSAAPPPSADDAPAGWKLVPTSFTKEMAEAFQGLGNHQFVRTTCHLGDFHERYAAMLAAAPDAPRSGDAPVAECHSFEVESKGFEAWAAGEKLPLEQHPLHYLFLDSRTSLARQAWRQAIAFCRGHATPVSAPSQPQRVVAESNFPDTEGWVRRQFLADGARFKLRSSRSGAAFDGFPASLSGRWVALVAADNDEHLRLSAPADARDGEDARLFRLLLDLIDQDDATVHCTMPGDGTQPDYDDVLNRDELLAHLREFPVPADRAMGAQDGAK